MFFPIEHGFTNIDESDDFMVEGTINLFDCPYIKLFFISPIKCVNFRSQVLFYSFTVVNKSPAHLKIFPGIYIRPFSSYSTGNFLNTNIISFQIACYKITVLLSGIVLNNNGKTNLVNQFLLVPFKQVLYVERSFVKKGKFNLTVNALKKLCDDYNDRCAIIGVNITYDTMYVDENNMLFNNVEPILRIMQSSANWKRSSWFDVKRRDEDLHKVASFSEDLVSSTLGDLFNLSNLCTSQRNSRVKRAEGIIEKHEHNISKEYLSNLYKEQNGKCSLSGIIMLVGNVSEEDWNPTEFNYMMGCLNELSKGIEPIQTYQDFINNIKKALMPTKNKEKE
ncbi:hypothetical protein ACTFIW_011858 [Dictyostelium discoideum]